MDNKVLKLSVIVPIYNEAKTLKDLIYAIENAELPYPHEKEIILVDDCSTDASRDILKGYENKHRVILHESNQGKGSALQDGFRAATGDIVLVQDADLEYSPQDYPLLLQPIVDGYADVVYGSRFITVHPTRVIYFSHYVANKLITFLSNMLTGLNLSDMETGYKVFTKDVIDAILPKLRSKRFGIEPEITARVAKHNFRIYEVGISYRGRTYKDGKKINWKDGLAAVWHVIRFNLFSKK